MPAEGCSKFSGMIWYDLTGGNTLKSSHSQKRDRFNYYFLGATVMGVSIQRKDFASPSRTCTMKPLETGRISSVTLFPKAVHCLGVLNTFLVCPPCRCVHFLRLGPPTLSLILSSTGKVDLKKVQISFFHVCCSLNCHHFHIIGVIHIGSH